MPAKLAERMGFVMAQLCYWLQMKVTLTAKQVMRTMERKPASAPPQPPHTPRRTWPCVGWTLSLIPPPRKVGIKGQHECSSSCNKTSFREAGLLWEARAESVALSVFTCLQILIGGVFVFCPQVSCNYQYPGWEDLCFGSPQPGQEAVGPRCRLRVPGVL